jgi:hypothetical protein
LCDILKRELQKSYFPPALVTLLQLLPKHWYLHCSDCIKQLIYAHTISRTLTACDINLGSLTLPESAAGEFVEFILLFTWSDLVNALINFGACNCSIYLLS